MNLFVALPDLLKAGPGLAGGEAKYDYVRADKPPPGNEGRTPAGYWKVPKGMSGKVSRGSGDPIGSEQKKKKDPLGEARKEVGKIDTRRKNGSGSYDPFSKDPKHFDGAGAEVHEKMSRLFEGVDSKHAQFHRDLAKKKKKKEPKAEKEEPEAGKNDSSAMDELRTEYHKIQAQQLSSKLERVTQDQKDPDLPIDYLQKLKKQADKLAETSTHAEEDKQKLKELNKLASDYGKEKEDRGEQASTPPRSSSKKGTNRFRGSSVSEETPGQIVQYGVSGVEAGGPHLLQDKQKAEAGKADKNVSKSLNLFVRL